MPKLKGIDTNGKKPYQKALDVLKIGVPVTPKEIDDYVGTGAYSSKYICFLKRDGYQFTSVKDGRAVVSYTLVAEGTPVVPKAKVTVVAVVKPAKEKPKFEGVAKAAARKAVPVKKAVTPKKEVIEKDEHMFEGATNDSYSIDNEFDSADINEIMDGL